MMEKDSFLYFTLALEVKGNHKSYQSICNVRAYSPLAYLIDFLESNWGTTATQDMRDPQFVSADYAYDWSIFCPHNNNACIIFHPIHIYDIEDFHLQYHKYLTPDVSFKITKENFIQIVDLWKKYKKQCKLFLLFWIDLSGKTFLEAFVNDEQLKIRVNSLLSQNLIITNPGYELFHILD